MKGRNVQARHKAIIGALARRDETTGAEPFEAVLRAVLVGLALVVGPIALFAAYRHAVFAGLSTPDALDFAQLGRNLSEGRGFVTYVLRPLALTHGSSAMRQPELMHGPGFPFCLALLFGGMGANDLAAANTSGLFYLLTIPLVYQLGRRLFTPVVGSYAALLFTVNAVTLQHAVSGRPITLAMFLMTALLLTLHTLAKRARDASASAAAPRDALIFLALLTACLYLTDPVFFWLFPVMFGLVYWLHPATRRRSLAVFGLALAGFCLPWLLRNALLGANPVFGLRAMDLWAHTAVYPDSTAYRTFPKDLSPGEFMLNAVARKMFLNASLSLDLFPQIALSWVLAFFLPSLLFRFRDEAVHAVRQTTLFCFAALFFGMIPLNLDVPLLACLAPPILIFAVAYLLHLVQQANLSRPAVSLVAAATAISAVVPVVRDMSLTEKTPASKAIPAAQALGRLSAPHDVCFSDSPGLAAWYGDRPAVWLPARDWDVEAIRKGFPNTRWLLLTEQARAYSPGWQSIYDGFARWNGAVVEAGTQRLAPPAPIAIAGQNRPLTIALNGFQSIAPPANSTAWVILAAVPADNGKERGTER